MSRTTRHEPTVSWLELMQDLVMVVLAIALFSGFQFSWGTRWMLWYAAAVTVAFGNWVAWTILNNRFPDRHLAVQLISMVWIVGAVLAAGSSLWDHWLPPSTLNLGMALAFAALALRHGQIAISRPWCRTASITALCLSLLATIVLALGAAFVVPEYVAMGVGPGIALFGLLVVYPRLLPRSDFNIDTDHLSERFGQFILILLGDGFLEIVLNVERGGTVSIPRIVVTTAILFLIWRAYFIYVLPRRPPSSVAALQRWVVALFGVIVGFGLTSSSLAADAVALSPEILEQLDAYTRAVPPGVTLALAYAAMALALLVSADRAPATAAIFAVVALLLGAVHFVLPSFLSWQGGMGTIVLLAVADAVAHTWGSRAREVSLPTHGVG